MRKGRNEETGAVFEVGYARPPKDGQFQKGQSGNPSGRRKDAEQKRVASRETMTSLIDTECQRMITGTENGKTFKAPVMQVIIRRILNRALNGDTGAAKLAFGMNEKAERENPPAIDAPDFPAMTQEEISKWYKKWAAMPTPEGNRR